MKHFLFIITLLFLGAPFANAQWSNPTPGNVGLPTGQDLVMDKIAFPAFNRLGHLEAGTYGDPSSKWAAIGVPNLNFPPMDNNYYGFLANNQSDRLFVGLRQEGPFNVSNAIIAFGDNHDNDPVPNRLVFQFDSWIPSFSKEIATMLHNGNVGIGTAAPTQRLHVSGGNILLDASDVPATTGNIFFNGVTYPDYQDGMRMSFFTGGPSNGYIDVRTSSAPTNGLIFRVDGPTGNTERMRIAANGDVTVGNRIMIGNVQTPSAIGSINTSNYRLFVRGGILTEQIVVFSGAAFPDYVFEPGYELLPLETVERHIQQEGHLPNTPSAAEVAQNGLDLGDMTLNQQEKIEELFLYVIQLNKAVQALQTENQALKTQLNLLNDAGHGK